jgi:hypothetical protein
MKNKIIIISSIFLGCYTSNLYATPDQLHINRYYNQGLNTELPLLTQQTLIKQKDKDADSDTMLIFASDNTKFSLSNLLILSTSKNAVLKAVLKKKSYGLRYTRIW